MRRGLSCLALLAGLASTSAGSPPAADSVPESLKARVVVWDISFKPSSESLWIARVAAEVDEALKDGVDVLIFPELIGWGLFPYKGKGDRDTLFITREWNSRLLPKLAEMLRGKDILVDLGSYPHQEAGWDHAFNRMTLWHRGAWIHADKLDPTQPEALEKPPIRPGTELPILSFKGGKVAPLICYSVEKPEIASRLKAEGVNLLLVPSATPDAHGMERILRTASARAVELGAAVLVAPLTGAQTDWSNQGAPAMFLPEQRGLDSTQQRGPVSAGGFGRQDFVIPWAAILRLRVQPEKPEVRPFLAPTSDFTLSIRG